MSEAVSAAIHIQGSTVRYAEVERVEDRRRLLRLGSCDFTFDAAGELLHADDPSRLDRIAEAVRNALDGTEADELSVTVHPPDGYSFFTPISAELRVRDRKLQLYQQAALVTGVRSLRDLHLSTKTVRTAQDSDGDAFMWVHVLVVPADVNTRIKRLREAMGVPRHTWTLSTEGASRVTARMELTGITQEQALRPFTLAVGQYAGHTEYTLSRDRQWYHSHHAHRINGPTDRAYFAVGLLNRLGVPLNAVGRLFVYGDAFDLDTYAPFRAVFGVSPEPLDPMDAVSANSPRANGDFNPGAFVPCIGASL